MEDLIKPKAKQQFDEKSITGSSPHSHFKVSILLVSLKLNLKATK